MHVGHGDVVGIDGIEPLTDEASGVVTVQAAGPRAPLRGAPAAWKPSHVSSPRYPEMELKIADRGAFLARRSTNYVETWCEAETGEDT